MYHRYTEQTIFTKLFIPRKFDKYAADAPEPVLIRA